MGRIRDFFRGKEDKETAGDVRIEVEDLIDQHYKCKEIAEETGLSEAQVYRIKVAKQRREARLSGKPRADDGDDENSVASLRKQLLEVELQGKIAAAKHEEYLRHLDREDEMGGPEELMESAQEGPDALLGTLLKTVISKQAMITPPAQQTITPAAGAVSQQEVAAGHPQDAPSAPPALTLDFVKLERAIKAGFLTKEDFVREAAAMNLAPEKAAAMHEFIRRKL